MMNTRFFLMLLVSLCSIPLPAGPPAAVIAVIDGDSVIAQVDGKLIAVRLIGINAPELFDAGGLPRQDGTNAAIFLRNQIQGRSILLESDPALPHIDPYGRRLAYIYRGTDGVLLNKQMICDGYASLYRGQPFRFLHEFAECEAQAIARRKGLWGVTGFAAEWESRFPGTKYLGEGSPGARPRTGTPRPAAGGGKKAPRRTPRRPR